jgi:HEPN domain-containing protein
MKPLTAEWAGKAEADFAVMEREGRVRKNPAYDSVCFHAQQCAEKYLKAILSDQTLEAGRTHDLVAREVLGAG